MDKQKIRILVVEDERITAESIKISLESFGYIVTGLVSTGNRAIQKAEEDRPDLILMDVVLKGKMDGIEAATAIRDQFNIPVVYLTAYSDEKTLARAKLTEPFGYLTKPFESRLLKITVDMALYKHNLDKMIKDSEEKYHALFEHANDSIFIINPSTRRFLDVNEIAARRLGYTRPEVLKLGIDDIETPMVKGQNEAISKEFKRKGSVIFEHTHRRKDGTEMPVEISRHVIEYGGQKVFQSIVRDITERKKAEKNQAKLQKNLESLWGLAKLIKPDLKTLSDYVLNELLERTKSEYGFYGFLNEDESKMYSYSYSQKVMNDCKIQDIPLEFSIEKSGLWAEAVRKRKPIIVNDYQKAIPGKKGLPKGHVKLNRILAVPVIQKGKIVAVSVLANKKTEYTDENIEQVTGFISNAQIILNHQNAEDMLIESEKKYRSLFETSPDSVLIVERKSGKIVDVNNSLIKLLGYKRDEIIGTLAGSRVVKGQKKEFKRRFIEQKKTGIFSGEIKLLRKDGGTVWVDPRSTSFGEYLIVFARDITKRKKAEKALSESEEKHRGIFEHSPLGIFSFDKTGQATACNENFANIIGASIKTCININLKNDLKDKEMTAAVLDCLSGNLGRYEGDYRSVKTNKVTPIKMNFSPLFSDSGGVIGGIGIVEDISERKKADEALRESEEKFRTMFEVAREGTIISGNDNKILAVNPAAVDILGYKSPQELVGITFDDIFAEAEDYESFSSALIENDYVEDAILTFKKKDGTLTYVLGSSAVQRDEKDNIQRIITEFIDYTDRKEAEDEIKRLKEFNENIVQSMEEGILILKPDGGIEYNNPKCLNMFKYSSEVLLGMHLTRLVHKSHHALIEEESKKWAEGDTSRFECVMVARDGGELTMFISATPMFDNDVFKSSLLTLTDITDMKLKERKLKEKARVYDIENGKVYLIPDLDETKTMDVYKDLLNSGYTGLIITRRRPEDIKERMSGDSKIFWMSNIAGDKTVPPNFIDIMILIREHVMRDTVVLLDRFEYLVLQRGFKEAMVFVQDLVDLFYGKEAILLVSLDPRTLGHEQLTILKEETNVVRLRSQLTLPDGCLELLNLIYKQNLAGQKPYISNIIKELKISKPTVIKRMRTLKRHDLIKEHKVGRRKNLEVTDQGKRLI
jgi:PAS domain S-box-containing protein